MKCLQPLIDGGFAFLLAVKFLTRLPVPLGTSPTAAQWGHSLLFHPLVGALIGAILWGLLALVPDTGLLASALILGVWVCITGALHLDGLADSADAWVGGFGDRARTLAIMKDPACGPMGVTALIVVLLIKFAALSVLIAQQRGADLLLATVLGRSAPLGLLLTTPYVRPGGLGEAFALNLAPKKASSVIVAVFALAPLLLGMRGLVVVAAVGLLFHWVRGALLRRLGGCTGDTLGALVELTETVSVLVSALY